MKASDDSDKRLPSTMGGKTIENKGSSTANLYGGDCHQLPRYSIAVAVAEESTRLRARFQAHATLVAQQSLRAGRAIHHRIIVGNFH